MAALTRRLALCLALWAGASTCVRKRTGMIVLVDTNMAQGSDESDAARRLTGLTARVLWGPRPGPTAPANRSEYPVTVVRSAAQKVLTNAANVRVNLPQTLFYLEPPDADGVDAHRWVRVEVQAETVDRAGARQEPAPPFVLEAPFVDGVTYVVGVFVDDTCVRERTACGGGSTCGPGGRCIAVAREVPPDGRPVGTVVGRCPDGGGECVIDEGGGVFGVPDGGRFDRDAAGSDDGPSVSGDGPSVSGDGPSVTGDASIDGGDGPPSDDAGAMDAPAMGSLDEPWWTVDPGAADAAGCPGCASPEPPPDLCPQPPGGPSAWTLPAGYDHCENEPQAFTKSSTNVAYIPYEVAAEAPVYSGVGRDRVLLGTLLAGDVVGLQSTRNPGCIDAPPLRPADYDPDAPGRAYRFGYAPDLRRFNNAALNFGWIDLALLRLPTRSRACLQGPAAMDFQGYGNSDRPGCPVTGCVGESHCRNTNTLADGRSDCAGWAQIIGLEDVAVRGAIGEDYLGVLRYAPGSSVYRLLRPGDRVRVIAQAGSWYFVLTRCSPSNRVACDGSAPRGLRGWLPVSSIVP
jgi:hypothetical protein